MKVTDVVADALTRIRNAIVAQHVSVEIPASKLKLAICEILAKEGYIKKYFFFDDGKQGKIKIMLKYDSYNSNAIKALRRVSKPGLRIYAKATNIPKVIGRMGIALISTSKGLMTDRDARSKNLGGEVLAYIW